MRGESSPDKEHAGARSTPMIDEQVKAIEEKNTQTGYETLIRLVAVSNSEHHAEALLVSMKSAFAQYATTDNNALHERKILG